MKFESKKERQIYFNREIEQNELKLIINRLAELISMSDFTPKEQKIVDLLIGTDLSDLHPKAEFNYDKLVIMSSNFGTGYTLMGHNDTYVKVADNNSQFRVNVCNVKGLTEIQDNVVVTESHIGLLHDVTDSLEAILRNLTVFGQTIDDQAKYADIIPAKSNISKIY